MRLHTSKKMLYSNEWTPPKDDGKSPLFSKKCGNIPKSIKSHVQSALSPLLSLKMKEESVKGPIVESDERQVLSDRSQSGTWTTFDETSSEQSLEKRGKTYPLTQSTTYQHAREVHFAPGQPISAMQPLPVDVETTPRSRTGKSSSPSWIKNPQSSVAIEMCPPRYQSAPLDSISSSSSSWDSIVDTKEVSLLDMIDSRDDEGDDVHNVDDFRNDVEMEIMRSRTADFHRSFSSNSFCEDRTYRSLPKLAQGPNSHLRGNGNKTQKNLEWIRRGLSLNASKQTQSNSAGCRVTQDQYLRNIDEKSKQTEQGVQQPKLSGQPEPSIFAALTSAFSQMMHCGISADMMMDERGSSPK